MEEERSGTHYNGNHTRWQAGIIWHGIADVRSGYRWGYRFDTRRQHKQTHTHFGCCY